MAAHLSFLGNALTVLLPGTGRNKGGASKPEASGGASGSSSGIGVVGGNVLEELNRARNRNAESIATLEGKIEQIERRYHDLAGECSTSKYGDNYKGRSVRGLWDVTPPHFLLDSR